MDDPVADRLRTRPARAGAHGQGPDGQTACLPGLGRNGRHGIIRNRGCRRPYNSTQSKRRSGSTSPS